MAKGLTTEQLKQMYGGSQPTQQPAQQAIPGGMKKGLSTEELRMKYSSQPVSTEPSIEEQKQERIAQGFPVSVREDRAEPTMAGNIIREIAKQPLKAGLSLVRPVAGYSKGVSLDTKYLGNVGDYGTEIEKQSQQLANKYKAGDISLGRAVLGGAGAGVLQAMDFAAVMPVGEVAQATKAGIASKSAIPGLKQAAKESLIRGGAIGAGYDVSGQLASGEKYNPMQTAVAGLAGSALDFGLTKALPEALQVSREKLSNAPVYANKRLDKSIRDIMSNTTGDLSKIEQSTVKAKSGLELLVKESPTIMIPDERAPIGSGKMKPFNPSKATGNEFLSGISELEKKVATTARNAAKDASDQGHIIDVNDVKAVIQDSIDNGLVPDATAKRMMKQIDSTGGDPLAIHDWVETVNKKYGKAYERGTIDDTAIGALADDIAGVLRSELDEVVDRKGYADAFGSIRELKRLVVGIAKKANRNINFGDISTDAGLDAAISLLTGNPAYMGRTVASGLFKGVVRKFMNNSGLRTLRRAATEAGRVETKARMPYGVARPPKMPLALPEGRGMTENRAGIQLPAPKKPTTFEPRAQVVRNSQKEQLALPPGRNQIELPKNVTKSKLGSDTTENAIIRNPLDRRKLLNKPTKSVISPKQRKEKNTGLPKRK